tara:strand:+ start:122 stop:340 length:219 start_codon:yes stop_codon:yes gene_type:complete
MCEEERELFNKMLKHHTKSYGAHLTEEEIKEVCASCATKEAFANCLKAKMSGKSCLTCYGELIQQFQKGKNV